MTPAARHLLALRRYHRRLRREQRPYRTDHARRQLERLQGLVQTRVGRR